MTSALAVTRAARLGAQAAVDGVEARGDRSLVRRRLHRRVVGHLLVKHLAAAQRVDTARLAGNIGTYATMGIITFQLKYIVYVLNTIAHTSIFDSLVAAIVDGLSRERRVLRGVRVAQLQTRTR